MFGKKALKEALESYQATLTTLQAEAQKQLADIKTIADAGERYERLLSFENAIHKKNEDAHDAFAEVAYKPSSRVNKVGGTILFGSFITLMAAIPGGAPLAVILAGVGGIGAGVTTVFASERRNDKVLEAQGDMPEKLKTIIAEARACREQILSKELKGVAASERFDALYERSEVKAAFAKAVTRQKVLGDDSVSKLDKKKFEP